VQRLHEEESKGVQGSLRDLAERLDAVTKQKELETTKRADAQEQVKELRAAAEKLRVTVRMCHSRHAIYIFSWRYAL